MCVHGDDGLINFFTKVIGIGKLCEFASWHQNFCIFFEKSFYSELPDSSWTKKSQLIFTAFLIENPDVSRTLFPFDKVAINVQNKKELKEKRDKIWAAFDSKTLSEIDDELQKIEKACFESGLRLESRLGSYPIQEYSFTRKNRLLNLLIFRP